MAKSHMKINHVFHRLDKGERLLNIASDIEVLNAQVEGDFLGKIGEFPNN